MPCNINKLWLKERTVTLNKFPFSCASEPIVHMSWKSPTYCVQAILNVINVFKKNGVIDSGQNIVL